MSTSDHPIPPLISPRSPSVARAQRERQNPAPTADPDLVAALSRVLEAEADAARLCQVAYELCTGSLNAPAPARTVDQLAQAHQAQVNALSAELGRLGAAAPHPDDRQRILTRDPEDLRYGKSLTEVLAAVAQAEAELAACYTQMRAQSAVSDALDQRLQDHLGRLDQNQRLVRALGADDVRF